MGNIANAREDLQRFWEQLQLESPAYPVAYYQLGDVDRSCAAQLEHVASGTSRVGCDEAEHVGIPSRAIDIEPILMDGSLATDPAHFAQISQVAARTGVDHPGPRWGWDYYHVASMTPDEEERGSVAGLAPWGLAAATGVVLWAWLGRRRR